jgi:transposase
LYDVTLTRWRACPRTHAYIAKRRAEGKSDAELRRGIKRYIARELFRALEATAAA